MKIGSMVICECGGNWYDVDTNMFTDGPQTGETLIVSGFQEGGKYLEFEEYPDLQHDRLPASYHKIYFREIQPPLTIDIQELISEPLTA